MPLIVRLLPAAIVIFGGGLADDIISLKSWQKLAGQALAAALAYRPGVQVGGVEGHPVSATASFLVTLAWRMACSKAINLLNGIDGLAGGMGLFSSITIIIAAPLQSNVALAMAAVPLAGCLLAFLFYNFHPASISLGDSGSLLIGFLFGCYGVIWSQKATTFLVMTAPLMLLAVPLLDTTLSIARRFLRHSPSWRRTARTFTTGCWTRDSVCAARFCCFMRCSITRPCSPWYRAPSRIDTQAS
jgi:UDP-GlcNAc:undecaprenyl-phosphate GlcNAc-1-phosphate transferase